MNKARPGFRISIVRDSYSPMNCSSSGKSRPLREKSWVSQTSRQWDIEAQISASLLRMPVTD